jgi:hypothetical protein
MEKSINSIFQHQSECEKINIKADKMAALIFDKQKNFIAFFLCAPFTTHLQTTLLLSKLHCNCKNITEKVGTNNFWLTKNSNMNFEILLG